MGAGISPYPMMLCLPQDDHERLLVSALEARPGISVRVEDRADGAGSGRGRGHGHPRPSRRASRCRNRGGCASATSPAATGRTARCGTSWTSGSPAAPTTSCSTWRMWRSMGGFTPEAFMNLGDRGLRPAAAGPIQRDAAADRRVSRRGAGPPRHNTFEDVRPAGRGADRHARRVVPLVLDLPRQPPGRGPVPGSGAASCPATPGTCTARRAGRA